MYKLLIVDDEYQIRNGLANYFPWEEYGFVVVGSFENGIQTLEFILKNPIDVLLTDIKMPFMNGIELVKNIRDLEMSIKIVFLSSYKEFEYAQQALQYGVHNYVLKPTNYKELGRVFLSIKEHLDKESCKQWDCLETGNSELSYYEKVINRVRQYIYINYREASIEKAARIISISPNYLSKLFKDIEGCYFSDFLLNTRMREAVKLLEDVKLKIYEVSERVGYSNAKNFTRAFKNYYKKTPMEYRRKS